MTDNTVLRRATVFMLLDNVSRVLEPIVKMACAVAFVGGAWGAFAYQESLVLVLMRLALLGLEKGVVWLGGSEPDDRSFVRQASGAFGFVFVVAGLVAAAGWTGLSLLDGSGFYRQAGHTGWILTAVPFQALAMVVLQALLSRQHLGEIILIRNLLLPLGTFGIPLALVAFLPQARDSILPAAYLAASGLAAAGALASFAWRFRASLGAWSLLPWPGASLLRYSLPVSVTDILQSIALRTDNALLYQFGGAREVEIYSVAIMVSKAVQAVRESFDGTALSFFSRREPELLGRAKRQGARYVTWVVAGIQQPLLAGIVLFGSQGLGLMDQTYASGYATLVATSILFTLSLPGNLAGTALMGMGKTYLLPVAQVVFLVSFVGLNAWLIPLHGSLGAGLSLGISTLVSGLLNYVLVYRVAQTWLLDWGSVLRPLAGSLLFLPLLLVHRPHDQGPAFALLLWAVLGAAWSAYVLRTARTEREAMEA